MREKKNYIKLKLNTIQYGYSSDTIESRTTCSIQEKSHPVCFGGLKLIIHFLTALLKTGYDGSLVIFSGNRDHASVIL